MRYYNILKRLHKKLSLRQSLEQKFDHFYDDIIFQTNKGVIRSYHIKQILVNFV